MKSITGSIFSDSFAARWFEERLVRIHNVVFYPPNVYKSFGIWSNCEQSCHVFRVAKVHCNARLQIVVKDAADVVVSVQFEHDFVPGARA